MIHSNSSCSNSNLKYLYILFYLLCCSSYFWFAVGGDVCPQKLTFPLPSLMILEKKLKHKNRRACIASKTYWHHYQTMPILSMCLSVCLSGSLSVCLLTFLDSINLYLLGVPISKVKLDVRVSVSNHLLLARMI